MKFILSFLLLLTLSSKGALGEQDDLGEGGMLVEYLKGYKGLATNEKFGTSVTAAGDINGDGYDDMIMVGSSVNVVYGRPIETWYETSFGPVITGMTFNDDYGRSVSSAGDINKDGYDDIIIGASGEGTVYVIYGGEKSSLPNRDLQSQPLDPSTTGFTIRGNSDGFGCSVSSAGDINNDGYDDIIIGSWGAAYVIYGGEKSTLGDLDLRSKTLDPKTTGFTLKGWALYDLFGALVRIVSDINKDGYDDMLIGAWKEDNGRGAIHVVYGGKKSSMANLDLSKTDLKPGTNGFTIQGKTVEVLGFSASSTGDVNKDGYNDILIGAKNVGEAYVIYGGPKASLSDMDLLDTSPDPATTGFTITGKGNRFGFSVDRAGDVNQDGYDDILIGAPDVDGIYVFYGEPKSTALNINLANFPLDIDKTGFYILDREIGGECGNSVSAGDINNDGVPDLFIGCPRYDSFRGETLSYGSDRCTEHCGTCRFLQLKCMACEKGYRIENQQCLECISNCATCTDSLTCQVCSGGYSLLGTTECVVTCPIGTYSLNGVCQDCLAPHVKYGSQCLTSCPGKTYLSNGECFDCSVECSKCTSDSVCQECADGFILSDSDSDPGSKICVKPEPNEEEEEGEEEGQEGGEEEEEVPVEQETQEKKEIKASTGVFEGTFLATAALSSGGSISFNFALVSKILRNMKYLDVTVSTGLAEAFYSWKATNGFIGAPKIWSQKSESKVLPTVFSRYGLDPEFLINFWKPLVLILIGLALFVIFKVIEAVYVTKNPQKKGPLYFIARQVNIAASNFALTIFYCNLDDVMLYFVIDIRSSRFDNGLRTFSSVLAIFFLVSGGLFIGLYLILVQKYQKMKSTQIRLKEFLAKCENIKLIFKDFKDITFFKQSFLLMIVGRSLLSSLIFATLFDYPVLQTTLLLVLNLGMLVTLLVKKPFKSSISKWGQIFCEIIVLIVSFCMFLLSMFDYAEYSRTSVIEKLSQGVIVLNVILLIGCAIVMIFSLLKALSESCFKRRKLARIYAAPSDQCSVPGFNQFSVSVPGRCSPN